MLSSVAEPWDFAQDQDAAELVAGMATVMLAHGGIGLAAPQVGVSKRVFIMAEKGGIKACFNPKIRAYDGHTETNKEGCLSFPGLLLEVERTTLISVDYQDAQGNWHEEELGSLEARCFQHELDHLNGVCIINHVSKLTLNIAQRKRNKVLKRKTR